MIKTVRYILVAAFAVLWALPMLWALIVSLKSNEALQLAGSSAMVPYPLTLENYQALFAVSESPRWFLNSILISTVATLCTLVLSSLGGFALARSDNLFAKLVFALLLVGMVIPEQAIFIPLHQLFTYLDLHNTYLALIVPRLASPFGVLLMTQFFRAVPKELEEAAVLDGASPFQILTRIMLPLAKPALATLALFTFLSSWNDFLWPLVSATDPQKYTLTLGLASLQGNFAQTEGLGFLMATVVFASFPMVIFYIYFQRYIVSGIAGLATKNDPIRGKGHL